jgi:hypothetical protein
MRRDYHIDSLSRGTKGIGLVSSTTGRRKAGSTCLTEGIMNDESLPLTPRPTEAPTPLVAIEEPREAQTPPTNPTVPLTIAHKDDHTADHVGEKVREVSETTPEKPTTPEARHPRLKATARYAGRVCGSALDRAIVLLIALAILAALKHVTTACGFPTP